MFTSVDMSKVAEAVINDPHLYFNEAKAEVIVGSLPTVLADESWMKQLLTNLVSNAIRFHDAAKPRVEVYASRRGERERLRRQGQRHRDRPPVPGQDVKDVPAAAHQGRMPGTGVGLAICTKILEHHGGLIWVSSELGKGSTVYFSIPKRTE